ncbi:MAG: hypothetical protein AAF654_03345 [Myxococcota bacterium]
MNHWDDLATRLKQLAELIEGEPDSKQRLYRFADGFLGLLKSYHQVILAEGKTSIRVEAALLSLDLRTAKSRLEAFLGRQA